MTRARALGLPLPGEPGCRIRSVPTEGAHFCGYNPL